MTPYGIVMEWLHSPSVTETDHDSTLELLECLRDAGFVVVPRVATPDMLNAANALPVTKQVNGLVGMTAIRQGGDTGLPQPPNSPIEQWWAAMVAAGENAT
jgi:hypothetical protein